MKNTKVLLWFGLLWLALASFWIMLTKSDVAMAQYNVNRNEFVYQWIDNVSENVYSLNFLDRNIMFLTGGLNGVFHMSKIPVIILWSIGNNWWISNILGWNDISLWNSDNITVIWWDELKVEDDNSNATLLWWYRNSIEGGMSSDTPVVLLWWVDNKVGFNHDANVIVGWSTNGIKPESQNVNILWWNEVTVYWDNIIAGWERIQGGFSDSFIFNDGENLVSWDGSWMFFLKVANGVGFGTWNQEGNLWAISNGAVKLWNLDIENVSCSTASSENVWLIGLWNGCVVWCTSGSADSMKWELLDYGDRCEKLCSLSPLYCTQWDIEESSQDYTGFCTEWIVSTKNAHMCNPDWLNLYKNVVFETYLIDSDEGCPSIDSVNNQCVFQCNEHVHLTWDRTEKRDWVTMCFKDCLLPWSTSEYTGHNVVVTWYSVPSVNCSNGAWVHDTCKSYKANIVCVDGGWYVSNSWGKATDTVNTQYIYGSCSLLQYRCDTTVYNLTREDIVNEKYDYVPTVWRYNSLAWNTASLLPDFFNNQNIYPGRYFLYNQINWNTDASLQPEKSLQNWVRWKYELCIDYNPATPNNQAPQNEIVCTEATPLPLQYHYRFTGECQSWYDLATEDNVCRKRCYYQGQVIKHWSRTTLYTWANAHCPDACHEQKFQCYDGTLYSTGDLVIVDGKFITGTAQVDTLYTYPSCSLTWEVCNGFIVNSGNYLLNQNIWTFTSCNTYSPAWILACTYLTTEYHLEACNANYYSNSDMTWCVLCPHGTWYHNWVYTRYQYISNTWSTNVTGCNITCSGGYHVNLWGGPCVACWTWKYNAEFDVSTQVCKTTYAPQTVNCTNCTNWPTNKSGFHYTSFGTWINNCPWICNKNWYLSGTYSNGKCERCPTNGSYVTDASWSTQLSQCRTGCQAGTYVATVNTKCVSCAVWKASIYHVVTGWSTSSCVDCTNGPTNKDQYPLNVGYYYTTSGTTINPTNCQWKCSSGYYLSGTYSNGKCIKCADWYYTEGSWQTQESACKIWCVWGQHISGAREQCKWCLTWTAYPLKIRLQPTFEACRDCTSGPTNKIGFHYTSYGTTWAGSCPWECDKDRYLSGTKSNGQCIHCPDGYYTVASWAEWLSACKIDCLSCQHVAVASQQCVPCPAWKTSNNHTVNGWSTSLSQCSQSCPVPDNASSIANTSGSCCNWECNKNFYKNAAGTWCDPCPYSYVTNAAWATWESACRTGCGAGTHVATARNMCVLCWTWDTTTTTIYVNSPNTFNCADCPSSSKPSHSHFIANTPTKRCNWECDKNYYKNWDSCIKCPDGYYTIASWAESLSQCKIDCPSCQHVAVASGQCVPCPDWKTSNNHTVNGWSTSLSQCSQSCTIPDNARSIANTSDSCCNWECNKNFYKNAAGTWCDPCPYSYVTNAAWATWESACRTGCGAGTHVATARNMCVLCWTWDTTTTTIYVNSPNTFNCTGCESNTKPSHSHFIANTPSIRCNWECDANYYKSGDFNCATCSGYLSPAWSTQYHQCRTGCVAWTHVAVAGETCVLCGSWQTSSSHTVYGWDTSDCTDCPSSSKPDHSHFIPNITGKTCNWECDANYYKSGDFECAPCPTSKWIYTSAAWANARNECRIMCEAGTQVVEVDWACVECPKWTMTYRHPVSAWQTGRCEGCADTLPSCAYYTNGCQWACGKDCYKNSDHTACESCKTNYHTDYSGNVAETACKIECLSGTYLKNPRDTSCTNCPVWSGSDTHKVQQWLTSICPNCQNKPTECSEYISRGIWINKCWWQCSANCYLSGTNLCPHCPDWSSSSAWAQSINDCLCGPIPDNAYFVNP